MQAFPAVPSSPPNPVLITGLRYAQVPTNLQQQLTLGFGISVSGFPINPITLPWSTINNRKLTLSFAPATQADEDALAAIIPDDAQTIDDLPTTISSNIRVLPELKRNGELIHRGTSALKLGEEMLLFKQAILPGRGVVSRPLSTIAGSYLAIGSESGSISSQNLEELREKVEQTQATLETEDPDLIQALNREDLLGDLFYAGMLSYYGQFLGFSELIGAQQSGHTLLLGGLGIHGYEPRVNTLFGFPRSVSHGGAVFDIPIAMINLTDQQNAQDDFDYAQEVGLLSSALEHQVLEQIFGTQDQPADAISTVKAFSKANAEGQRIYQLTSENMAETLPNLNLDSETEAAIEQALFAGFEVTTHTNTVSASGWTGAGYMVVNPDTGSGAYLISGGMSGGILANILTVVILILSILGIGSGVFIFLLVLIAVTSSFISFIDRLQCSGTAGKIAIGVFLALSSISLIRGGGAVNSLRKAIAKFINTNGLSAGANAACSQ